MSIITQHKMRLLSSGRQIYTQTRQSTKPNTYMYMYTYISYEEEQMCLSRQFYVVRQQNGTKNGTLSENFHGWICSTIESHKGQEFYQNKVYIWLEDVEAAAAALASGCVSS